MGGTRKARLALWAATAVAAGGAVAGAIGDWTADRVDQDQAAPEVVLKRGTFRGMPWVFGISRHTSAGDPCVELLMDATDGACSSFPPSIEKMEFYTTSGGDPSGIKTAQGFVSRDVESVVTLAGGRPAGEAHIVDLPEPVGGKFRWVVAFVTEAQVGTAGWVAVAFDDDGRVVGREVLF